MPRGTMPRQPAERTPEGAVRSAWPAETWDPPETAAKKTVAPSRRRTATTQDLAEQPMGYDPTSPERVREILSGSTSSIPT